MARYPDDDVSRDYLAIARERMRMNPPGPDGSSWSEPVTMTLIFASPLEEGRVTLSIDGEDLATVPVVKGNIEHRVEFRGGKFAVSSRDQPAGRRFAGGFATPGVGLDRAGQGLAGLTASYSNTVLLGIPIVLTAFGDEAALPLFLVIATHNLVPFPPATALNEQQIEGDRETQQE